MNILEIIVLVILLWKIRAGYKRGMVKEVISFFSLIVLCVVIGLIGKGLQSYMEREYLGIVIAAVLLWGLGIAHSLLGLILFPAKLLVKLPIIQWVDKLLGAVVGALETVIVLWTVFYFAMSSAFGLLGQQILDYTAQSTTLSLFYDSNLLAQFIGKFIEKI